LDQMEDPIEVANIFLLLFRISTQDEANAPSC